MVRHHQERFGVKRTAETARFKIGKMTLRKILMEDHHREDTKNTQIEETSHKVQQINNSRLSGVTGADINKLGKMAVSK